MITDTQRNKTRTREKNYLNLKNSRTRIILYRTRFPQMNSKLIQMATSTIINEEEEEEEEYYSQYAMQLASASVLPMALKAATDLGVLEIIEKAGPSAQLSSSQIASQLASPAAQTAPHVLDRILLVLASNSILTCSATATIGTEDGQLNRFFGLAPVAKYFIKNHNGGCLAPFLAVIHDKVIMDTW